MKEYSGIIFDLDGTLYEKNKMGLKMIINKPFDARRIKASRTVLKNLEGSFFKTGDAFLEKYYTLLAEKIKTNITNAKKWEQESFYKNFISILKKTKPRQGIEELIKSFHCPCIILSDYAMIDERLKALNINPELFSHRLYSGDLGGLKPSSEVFLRASEIMECKPETILVIGDDP
ncbi:MAG: HAD family hydrolase, partial [Spirochaetales bacterium]|nr:HAD family hydrolase [Spirochaetales bacterium]